MGYFRLNVIYIILNCRKRHKLFLRDPKILILVVGAHVLVRSKEALELARVLLVPLVNLLVRGFLDLPKELTGEDGRD